MDRFRRGQGYPVRRWHVPQPVLGCRYDILSRRTRRSMQFANNINLQFWEQLISHVYSKPFKFKIIIFPSCYEPVDSAIRCWIREHKSSMFGLITVLNRALVTRESVTRECDVIIKLIHYVGSEQDVWKAFLPRVSFTVIERLTMVRFYLVHYLHFASFSFKLLPSLNSTFKHKINIIHSFDSVAQKQITIIKVNVVHKVPYNF